MHIINNAQNENRVIEMREYYLIYQMCLFPAIFIECRQHSADSVVVRIYGILTGHTKQLYQRLYLGN